MNLPTHIKQDITHSLIIGCIKLEISANELTEHGVRYYVNVRSISGTHVTENDIYCNYAIVIRNVNELDTTNVYCIVGASKVDNIDHDDSKGWIANRERILFELLCLVRHHIRGVRQNFVTEEQYSEIFYQIYTHVLKPLGFNGQHIADMQSRDDVLLPTSIQGKENYDSTLGNLGDLRGLLTACYHRPDQPAWVRNGCGQVTSLPVQKLIKAS